MADCAELRELYETDQHDRRTVFRDDPVGVRERDERRRARLQELLDAGLVVTAADHFHAAMIFQHGASAASFRRARELALLARTLGDDRGTWLAAAALDRWLSHSGRPQRYGTQYHGVAGRWELMPVDPSTTDDERAEWNVPRLHEAFARAERMTKENPPPAETSWRSAPVPIHIDRVQLERGDTIEVNVPGLDEPVTIRLAGLRDIVDVVNLLELPGQRPDGSDLLVRLIISVDDANDGEMDDNTRPTASTPGPDDADRS